MIRHLRPDSSPTGYRGHPLERSPSSMLLLQYPRLRGRSIHESARYWNFLPMPCRSRYRRPWRRSRTSPLLGRHTSRGPTVAKSTPRHPVWRPGCWLNVRIASQSAWAEWFSRL